MKKFMKGRKIFDPLDAMAIILLGEWLFWNDKPMSPSWLINMKMKTIEAAVGKGILYLAVQKTGGYEYLDGYLNGLYDEDIEKNRPDYHPHWERYLDLGRPRMQYSSYEYLNPVPVELIDEDQFRPSGRKIAAKPKKPKDPSATKRMKEAFQMALEEGASAYQELRDAGNPIILAMEAKMEKIRKGKKP